MPTLRTSLLTITALLASLAAAAQPTIAAGPQPVDVLGWITWGAAFIVLLMGLIASLSVASAAQRSYAEAAAKPAPAPLLTAATTSASRPALTPPVAAEAVAA